MSDRHSVSVAARLARIRDKVADRARADLAAHDAQIRATEDTIDTLHRRRHEVEEMIRPAAGSRVEPIDRAASRWAGLTVDRALRSAKRDLERKKTDRVRVQAEVRRLALEAERTAKMHSLLEDAMTAEARKREAKALDEAATQVTLRKAG